MITYHDWILKYVSVRAEQKVHLKVAMAKNWFNDLVEDKPGRAAVCLK